MPSPERANSFIPASFSPNSTAGSPIGPKARIPAAAMRLRAYLVEGSAAGLCAARFLHPPDRIADRQGPLSARGVSEDASVPTVLTYGHGDVVDGMEGEWRDNLDPWRTTTRRAIASMAAAPPTTRASTASTWRRCRPCARRAAASSASMPNSSSRPARRSARRICAQVCEALREELKADLFLASDGPRLSADRPTIFLGCRGGVRIHLDVKLRDGGTSFRQLGRRAGQSRDHPVAAPSPAWSTTRGGCSWTR